MGVVGERCSLWRKAGQLLGIRIEKERAAEMCRTRRCRWRGRVYEVAISARYAFSLPIQGIVLGKVACALAKWEKVAGPADPMFTSVGVEVAFSWVVVEVEFLLLSELRREPMSVSSICSGCSAYAMLEGNRGLDGRYTYAKYCSWRRVY